MIQSIIIKVLFCSFLFAMVAWYWNDSSESTKTGLFFFIFTLAFFQNAYYTHKLEKLKDQKKSDHS